MGRSSHWTAPFLYVLRNRRGQLPTGWRNLRGQDRAAVDFLDGDDELNHIELFG